jgi:ABC-type glycerol-3-phosphate transport system permease component
MNTATIKKLHFGAYIKWSLVAYANFSVFTALFRSLSAYATARENLGGYLLWYRAEIFFLYATSLTLPRRQTLELSPSY